MTTHTPHRPLATPHVRMARRPWAQWTGLWLLASVLAFAPGAWAQETNEWANCQEVTDPDVRDRMDLCAAHAGCKLVLKVHKTCTAVRGFVDRLGQSIGQGVKTLFGYRKEIQADNLWEAVQTENTRQLDELPSVKTANARLTEGLARGRTDIETGTHARGVAYAIMGEKADPSRPERWALVVESDGEIKRGQYVNGRLQLGDVVRVTSNGETSRVVGDFHGSGSLTGTGAQVNPAGTVSEGLYVQGGLTQGSRRYKTGEREEGQFEKVGNASVLVQGSKYGRDGSLTEKGAFRNGELVVGERYANGQVVATVDADRALRERAQARQQAELEKLKDDKTRREAEAAQREQAFKDQLQRANAGELFALADQWREQRDADKARQALRALITRFPNHPLANAAAGQLVPDQPAPANRAAATSPSASASAARPDKTGGSAPRQVSLDDARRQCLPPASAVRQAAELSCEGYRMIAPDHSGSIRQSQECYQNLRGMSDDALLRSMDPWINPQTLQAPHLRQNYPNTQASKWFGPLKKVEMEAAECTEKLVNDARRGVSPSATTANASSLTGRTGQRFGPPEGDVCRGEPLRLPPSYEAALAGLPQNSPSVLIRGALIGIDMQLDAYRQCARTPGVIEAIQALENQRSQALTTCRQIVSTDNCLVSPF